MSRINIQKAINANLFFWSWIPFLILTLPLFPLAPTAHPDKKLALIERNCVDREQEIIDASSSAETLDFLSDLEKRVWREMNWARLHPKLYASYLEVYLAGFDGENYRFPDGTILETREGKKAVIEAIQFLKNARPTEALIISRGLCWAAADHVRDHGPNGIVGHRGSSGSTPAERARRYGIWEKSISEIVTYGFSDPRSIVISFIVDDGVPDRGHRKDLFNSRFRYGGLSFGPHSHYQSMCVIDLAGDYQEYVWN